MRDADFHSPYRIEKHHTEKFTYQITGKGREYLEKHQAPITDQELKNLDGADEVVTKANQAAYYAGKDGLAQILVRAVVA
jgi:DNA-binding PadR family transcriptional regulator